MSLRVRMLGGTQVGLRASDPPVVAAGHRAHAVRIAAGPPGVFREQQLARDRQPAHRRRPAPRRRACRRPSIATAAASCATSSSASATGTAQGHWNNFLYYAARERLRLLPGLRACRAATRGARRGLAERHKPDRTGRRRAGHPARPHRPRPLRRTRAADRADGACREPGRDRQHRLPARARRVQHPSRGRRDRRSSRRLHPRQGSDAQRRRRRRDDQQRHP